jgi:hypothetical protein
MTTTRNRSPKRKASSSTRRAMLHPERLWQLFRRAGLLAKLGTVVLLAAALLGLAFLVVPFGVIAGHPDPPPLEVLIPCPPPVVSAVAGSGGMANPVPSVAEMAATQDALCAGFGRQRTVTGVLLLLAGVVNAAALLEWSRLRRRAKRRQRRARRAAATASREPSR